MFSKSNVGNAAQVLRLTLGLPYKTTNRIVKDAIVYANNLLKTEAKPGEEFYTSFGDALDEYLTSEDYFHQAKEDGIEFEVIRDSAGDIETVVYWVGEKGMTDESVVDQKIAFLTADKRNPANTWDKDYAISMEY